jgi:transposase-like protein
MTRPPSKPQPPTARLTTARRKSLTLDLLSQGHTLAHIKKVLGINRVTVYRWRQDDPSFAQAYSDAMEAGTDLIEQEARRRAVDGYDRPVFQDRKRDGAAISRSGQAPPSARLPTARRKSLALSLLGQGHMLTHVRTVLGINRLTIYRWRRDDPGFTQAYADAMEAGTDVIEQEVWRRAVEGYDRPVFQGGKMVGLERVYSDRLAILLLRGRRPEVYRDMTSRGAY